MNRFDKRLLAISFLLHIFILFFASFIGSDSRIKRTFLAYGRHSRYMTHAYFRRMKVQNGRNYQKYLKQRNLVHKKKKRKTSRLSKQTSKKKPKPKELAKKRVVKKRPSKKTLPKKKVLKKQVTKEIEEQEEMLYFNLMGETDPKMLVYQQHIQREVDRLWRPPIGVPKGAECFVQFTVDKYGKVKHFEIIKSSKIVIYDLSIVRVAKKFTFHKCLWGKSFPINFRQ
jgi:hypothetical protein